jgi:2-polyprenyl-6-methoxyphenol hydroxylase-like FAD-dependent oxidoreductase
VTRDRGEVDILIIGGGMAGLLTALAIAEDGRSVAVIERDHGPAVPEARPGIPQGRFVHQLLARGLQLVGEIVPDAESILRAAGAVPIEWHTEVRWLTAVGWMPRSDSYQLTTLSCSRELLEHVVRVRLRAHPSITLHEGHDVHGLIVRDGVVCGVETAPRGAHSAAVPSRLSARLVIDASGRNGRTLRWLADVGVHEVDEAVVDARLGYASTIVPIVADRLREKALVVHPKAPEHTRSGTIFPLEGGRWIVTLTGINADYPPLDAAGFLEFARSLRSPELHAAIASTPELGTIRGFRNTANRFRHFERLTAWPRGFAVIGDAVCAFNPVYGQGMTVAATTALVVRDWLRSGAAAADSHALQREVARLFQTPWAMSTSTDRSYAGTTYVGDEPSIAPQIARMVAAAVTDASAHHRFLQVMHMLAPLPHP